MDTEILMTLSFILGSFSGGLLVNLTMNTGNQIGKVKGNGNIINQETKNK